MHLYLPVLDGTRKGRWGKDISMSREYQGLTDTDKENFLGEQDYFGPRYTISGCTTCTFYFFICILMISTGLNKTGFLGMSAAEQTQTVKFSI